MKVVDTDSYLLDFVSPCIVDGLSDCLPKVDAQYFGIVRVSYAPQLLIHIPLPYREAYCLIPVNAGSCGFCV